MDKFEFKMSIIVPIYNVEKYINNCIGSILRQTMQHEDIEVLLIDDGSVDRSLEICKRYAELYPMFKVISKVNEGVSKTRNLGISLAKGKYIFYLDADDTISDNTLLNVWKFFEKHYLDIDLVTYPLRKYDENGKKIGKEHYRYKYLNKTGVYSLEEYPYIVQTTMNICVKNTEENTLFNENIKVHEDQDYITRILKIKGRIGFVQEAEYRYLSRSNSVMNSISAIDLWSPTIERYEKMFEEFDIVPVYFQALFFNDIKWKLVSDILYPSHLEKTEFEAEIERMKKLLEKVDVKTILTLPETDVFHRYYWLSLKPNNNIVIRAEKDSIELLCKNEVIYSKKNIELITYRILATNNTITMLFCVKTPVFEFGEKPVVYAVEKVKSGYEEKEMSLFDSAFDYYKTRVKTNKFFSFYYQCDIENVENVAFQIEIDGIRYNSSFYFMPQCQIDPQLNKLSYIYRDKKVRFGNGKFYFCRATCEMREYEIKDFTDTLEKTNPEIAKLRKMAIEIKKNKKIWLYYDCQGVTADNGYYQFLHDWNKEDGIDRYYISDNSQEIQVEMFSDEQKKSVVQFGSMYHKLLYLKADKIITAFIEKNNYDPFEDSEDRLIKDMINFEIVYLQHGILHAHLPWKYSPEKINIDKVVVSSYFEIDNFIHNYGFNDNMLVKSGMPRFDYFDKNVKAKNKILFAPTWRKYLIGNCVNNAWELKENEFLESKFYKKIMAILNSKQLDEVLKRNNLELDFKLHPIFKPYEKFFTTISNYINVGNTLSDDEYIIFITDFSSYVFDFAYRKRNIIYFLPDKEEFMVGLNGYRELDLPFERAFGKLITEEEEVTNEIEKIVNRNYSVESCYKERMDKFYLPFKECCEGIYQNLIQEK